MSTPNRTHIKILPLPPDTDPKVFYNHASVLPDHVYRALSLTTSNAVEIQLGTRTHFLPERCYTWVSPDE